MISCLCVPKTSSTSCGQAIFVDRATGASAFSGAVPLMIDRFGQRFQRRGCVQRAVRPGADCDGSRIRAASAALRPGSRRGCGPGPRVGIPRSSVRRSAANGTSSGFSPSTSSTTTTPGPSQPRPSTAVRERCGSFPACGSSAHPPPGPARRADPRIRARRSVRIEHLHPRATEMSPFAWRREVRAAGISREAHVAANGCSSRDSPQSPTVAPGELLAAQPSAIMILVHELPGVCDGLPATTSASSRPCTPLSIATRCGEKPARVALQAFRLAAETFRDRPRRGRTS